jgi:hypothetical protein
LKSVADPFLFLDTRWCARRHGGALAAVSACRVAHDPPVAWTGFSSRSLRLEAFPRLRRWIAVSLATASAAWRETPRAQRERPAVLRRRRRRSPRLGSVHCGPTRRMRVRRHMLARRQPRRAQADKCRGICWNPQRQAADLRGAGPFPLRRARADNLRDSRKPGRLFARTA